jgi:uncharacterized membrane protein YgcG
VSKFENPGFESRQRASQVRARAPIQPGNGRARAFYRLGGVRPTMTPPTSPRGAPRGPAPRPAVATAVPPNQRPATSTYARYCASAAPVPRVRKSAILESLERSCAPRPRDEIQGEPGYDDDDDDESGSGGGGGGSGGSGGGSSGGRELRRTEKERERERAFVSSTGLLRLESNN